jgi:hypothetical protein
MIRFFLGLLLVFGAVGGLDADQSLLACGILAGFGLAVMLWGVTAINYKT